MGAGRVWDRIATASGAGTQRFTSGAGRYAKNQLTGFGRQLFQGLYEELAELDEKIAAADSRIQIAFQNTPDCQRIAAVEGVGPLIATAIVAAISNGHAFRTWQTVLSVAGLGSSTELQRRKEPTDRNQ